MIRETIQHEYCKGFDGRSKSLEVSVEKLQIGISPEATKVYCYKLKGNTCNNKGLCRYHPTVNFT